jgi:gluconate 2-dehydrogenase subunit 3-like protein
MAAQDFTRREIVRILGIAAVAAHSPVFARWRYADAHPLAGAAAGQPAEFVPQFFSATEFALIERLAELIIPSDDTPGAREAGVAEFVDFMVAHDGEQQYDFRTGLTWLNAHSGRLLGRPFLELTPAEQIALLEPLAYRAKYRDGEEEGREFFRRIRELTVMGFYTSEIGYRELDNPALRLYSQSPACPHPDDPGHLHLPPPKW